MFTPGNAKFPLLFICVAAVLLFVPGFLSSTLSQESPDPDNCISCHQEVYGQGMVQSHLHAPFFKQACDKCHGTHEVLLKGGQAFTRGKTRSPEFRDTEFLTERTVLLKGLRSGAAYDVNVTFQDRNENRVTEEFIGVEVVAAGTAGSRVRDRRPPRVSNIVVGPIEKGPFLSTVISWETDEPATSTVMCGLSERYGETVQREDVWVKRHRVPVYGLLKDRQYHFRVLSTDIFGNESRSEELLFTTRNAVHPSAARREDGDTARRGSLAVTQAQLFLVGSDLGLYLETDRPSTVRVEWSKEADLPEPASPGSKKPGYEVRLDGLRRGRDLTIDACTQYGCHTPASLGVSHPVGVPLRNTSVLPINLPTLEGGIITCVSCHLPHGGKRKYFAQDDFSKDLCVTCHTEF